ncbi:uncharacterized protein PG986_013870 [Apiospora aurea]|uniref:Uncharacterized protein n=1 Tax=Apiospora aurea TaxID=335848 RepID=A0ABR1PX45_9PEZI
MADVRRRIQRVAQVGSGDPVIRMAAVGLAAGPGGAARHGGDVHRGRGKGEEALVHVFQVFRVVLVGLQDAQVDADVVQVRHLRHEAFGLADQAMAVHRRRGGERGGHAGTRPAPGVPPRLGPRLGWSKAVARGGWARSNHSARVNEVIGKPEARLATAQYGRRGKRAKVKVKKLRRTAASMRRIVRRVGQWADGTFKEAKHESTWPSMHRMPIAGLSKMAKDHPKPNA